MLCSPGVLVVSRAQVQAQLEGSKGEEGGGGDGGQEEGGGGSQEGGQGEGGGGKQGELEALEAALMEPPGREKDSGWQNGGVDRNDVRKCETLS